MSGHANFAPIGHNLPPVQGGVPGPAAPQPAPQPQPPAEIEPPVADGRLRGTYDLIPDASRPNLAVVASFDILNA